ncbi:hypothetical protein AB6A40_000045 [Gnathostoma spinigerum]|uniref:Peroxidase n=1 Tax=Gnathostoma spinigerum TaxID=75299 RepID=A0ABD6E3A2_9BILA
MRFTPLCIFFFAWTSFCRSSYINCGKSFFPCSDKSSNVDLGFPGKVANRKKAFPKMSIPESILRLAAEEARFEVNMHFIHPNISRLETSSQISPALKQYAYMHKIDQRAKQLSYSAYISAAMSQRLRMFGSRDGEFRVDIPTEVLQETPVGDICPLLSSTTCEAKKYRSHSGFCNNVAHPVWGAAYEPLQRMMKPNYRDGVMTIRQSKSDLPLPNPRQISLTLFSRPLTPHRSVTLFFAYWAQFIFKDISFIASTQSMKNGIPRVMPCCQGNFHDSECNNIDISPLDPFYHGWVVCIPSTRTIIAPKEYCQLGPRDQANQVSSFLDASPIYGSTSQRAEALRTFHNGRLLTLSDSSKSDLLPRDPLSDEYCQTPNGCFLSGTNDVNLLPGITVLHTVLVREHNHIANILQVS